MNVVCSKGIYFYFIVNDFQIIFKPLNWIIKSTICWKRLQLFISDSEIRSSINREEVRGFKEKNADICMFSF